MSCPGREAAPGAIGSLEVAHSRSSEVPLLLAMGSLVVLQIAEHGAGALTPPAALSPGEAPMWVQHYSMYDNSSTTVAEKFDAVVAALEAAGEHRWRLGALFEDDLGDKRGTPGRGAARIARDFPNLARFHHASRGEVISVDGNTGHVHDGLTLAQARAILGAPQKYLLGQRAVVITGVSLLTSGEPPPPWSGKLLCDNPYHSTQGGVGYFGPRIIISKSIIGFTKGAIEVYACRQPPPSDQAGRLQITPELAAFCKRLGRCVRRHHTFWETPEDTAALPEPGTHGSLIARLQLKLQRIAPPAPAEPPPQSEVEAELIALGWKSRRLRWHGAELQTVLARTTPTGNQLLWRFREVMLRGPLRFKSLSLPQDTPAGVNHAAELLLEHEHALVGHGHAWFATDDHDVGWSSGGDLVGAPAETWALGRPRDDSEAVPAAKAEAAPSEAIEPVPAALSEALDTLLASRLSAKDQARIDQVFRDHDPALVARALLVAAKSARAKPLERALQLLNTQLHLSRPAPERLDAAIDALLATTPEAAVVRAVAGLLGDKGRDDADLTPWVLALVARLGQPSASPARRTFAREVVVGGLCKWRHRGPVPSPAFAAVALRLLRLERAKGAGTHRWDLLRCLDCWDDGRAWPTLLIELASPPAKLPALAYNGWVGGLLDEWHHRDHPALAPWFERLGLPTEGAAVGREHVVALTPEDLATLQALELGVVEALDDGV